MRYPVGKGANWIEIVEMKLIPIRVAESAATRSLTAATWALRS